MRTRRADQVGYGIELSCFMPEGHQVPRGDTGRGLQVPPIDQWMATGWEARRSDQPGHDDTSFTSPQLAGEAGLTEIVCLVDWLAEVGAWIDDRCHFGIWVDADRIDAEAA